MRLFMAILLSALALVAASPTLPPRACSTIYPNIYSLVSSQPDEPVAPVTYNQSAALVVGGVGDSEDLQAILQFPHLQIYNQPSSPSDPQGIFQYLDFQVPAGSYGCQLSIIDENSQLYSNNSSNIYAPYPALNVRSLFPNAICDDPTFNSVLKADPSVIQNPSWGTFTLSPGASTVINSAACPPASEGEDGHAQFVLEFAQPGGGYNDWILPQLTAIDSDLQISEGVYMTYNC
jgi:hypothetical protein